MENDPHEEPLDDPNLVVGHTKAVSVEIRLDYTRFVPLDQPDELVRGTIRRAIQAALEQQRFAIEIDGRRYSPRQLD